MWRLHLFKTPSKNYHDFIQGGEEIEKVCTVIDYLMTLPFNDLYKLSKMVSCPLSGSKFIYEDDVTKLCTTVVDDTYESRRIFLKAMSILIRGPSEMFEGKQQITEETCDKRLLHNVTKINPTPDDDETCGYSIHSKWINMTTGDSFLCVDNKENEADWRIILDEFETTDIPHNESPDESEIKSDEVEQTPENEDEKKKLPLINDTNYHNVYFDDTDDDSS